MYPGIHAARDPAKIAARVAETGESLTYGELEDRSIRLAHVLHEAGLRRGDVVALLTENHMRAFEVYWAALRSGLYVTAVNHNLSPTELAYVLDDSGSAALVVSAAMAARARSGHAMTLAPKLKVAYGGGVEGYASYEDALGSASAAPFDDQPRGATMLYSSGTTGRPKGVRPPLPSAQVTVFDDPVVGLAGRLFGVGPDTVYLSPAPIHHAAPLRWCGAVHALGGTVVMLQHFDAERALRAIQDHNVTHAQLVPTMFVRMLQLPDAVRAQYDTSSLHVAIHAAAPCPIEVKLRMIEWWGPVLVEYYAGTEGNGMTMVDSATWATRQGTVGRSVLGTLHICDDETGAERPPGEVGTVYFEREQVPFTYHNDPEKTLASQHPQHPTWTTLGDIGYLDSAGYLFLTDRKDFTIISGGVNIYPQEIENVLALHPAVNDLAVIGLPDHELGEAVTAFVKPASAAIAGPDLEREIIAFVKSKIASFKAPRSVWFVDSLPRTESGKLAKNELKKRFGKGDF